MNPAWTLAAVGVAAGALMMWAFLRLADAAAIGRSVNRIQAHLLEFWLFVDEPSLVWKSWRGLLAANGRFLRLLLVPLALLAIPMLPLAAFLDAWYGSAPLPVGRPALVTMGMNRALDTQAPVLRAPGGITVEGPPVRVFSAREVSWRIRPREAATGELQLTLAGTTVEKSVAAGAGTQFLSRRRTRSLAAFALYPTEARLAEGPVKWVEVDYPSAAVVLFGLEAHWLVWFFLFSVPGAILAAKWGPR